MGPRKLGPKEIDGLLWPGSSRQYDFFPNTFLCIFLLLQLILLFLTMSTFLISVDIDTWGL